MASQTSVLPHLVVVFFLRLHSHALRHAFMHWLHLPPVNDPDLARENSMKCESPPMPAGHGFRGVRKNEEVAKIDTLALQGA